MLIQTLPVGPLQTNCYLLCDEASKTCAVIDPGAEGERVAQWVAQSGYTPVAIFLTHGHFDHFTDVPLLLQRYPGLPVYLHEADLCTEGEGVAKARFACPPMPNMRHYEEGDRLTVGELELSVLETPGHTSGCVTLQVENALITGDTLFAGSCGRTDLPRSSMKEMFASLKRLAQLEGDYLVYPGHGESSTLSAERCSNPYMRRALQL